MKADIIFYNGIIYPVIPEGVTYQAIGIKDKKILFIGDLNSIDDFTGEKTRLYDLKGQILLPGFIDTHAHLLDTGLNEILLNFMNMTSLNDVLDEIKNRAEITEEGLWIKGGNLDESLLLEKRLPTREELDEIGPNHPIYINHRSYHCSIVNSLALDLLDLDSNLKGFESDASGNFASGLLTYDANSLTKGKISNLVSNIELEQAYKAVSKLAASVGLTTIHCIEGGDYWSDLYPDFLLKVVDKTFDPLVYFNTSDIEKIKSRALKRMGGDIFLDGSLGNRSAALIDDYSDAPGSKGTILIKKEDLKALITKAHLSEIQISFHAIGDRAIDEILRAFEETIPNLPPYDHRHRIEHFGVTRPDYLERAKKLKLAIATQPAFTYQKEKTYKDRLGEERFLRSYPLKDIISAGILVGGGSDSLVSPLDPIFGIHCGVNAPNKDQRITVEEGIKLYTIWAAALAFEENFKGSLEVGKDADLVILDRDIRNVSPSDIKDIRVNYTIFKGEVVFKRS